MRGLGASLGHILSMARGLVAAGRYVDISGLDRQVGLLCAKTLDLPPEDGRTLRPMLMALLAELDDLSDTLIEQGWKAANTDKGPQKPTS